MRLTIQNPLQFSNQIYNSFIKSNQMLVFEERGKPEYPEKNLSEQSREPTNSAHTWRRVRESNPGHIGWRRALSPLRSHHCALTTALSPLRSHHCALTTALSPLRSHHCALTTALSPLRSHHCAIPAPHSHVVRWPTKADDISKMYVCPWLAVAGLQQNSKKL